MQLKELQRLAVLAVVFASVVLVGDRALSFILEKAVAASHNRHVSMYTGKAGGDVLVVGNSRADRHFPPRMIHDLTDLSVVNVGLGGVSMRMSEILVKDYLDRYPPPKLLVVEASNLGADPGEIGDMRLFMIYSERIRLLERELRPHLYYVGEVFHLFRFNNFMFVRTLYELRERQSDRLHRGVISDAVLERLARSEGVIEEELPEPHPENVEAFQRLLAYAAELDIPTRAVVTPYLHLPDRDRTTRYQWLTDEIDAVAGPERRVWDYSHAVEDTAGFRDPVHLNAQGVEMMLRTMMDDGFFESSAPNLAAH